MSFVKTNYNFNNLKQYRYFYAYLEERNPDWLAGVVAGPVSPPIPATRKRLPEKYRLRHYPDITHTIRCQYPTEWWDQAFALPGHEREETLVDLPPLKADELETFLNVSRQDGFGSVVRFAHVMRSVSSRRPGSRLARTEARDEP